LQKSIDARAHLATATGTPDSSGSNLRLAHICRLNAAFRLGPRCNLVAVTKMHPWRAVLTRLPRQPILLHAQTSGDRTEIPRQNFAARLETPSALEDYPGLFFDGQ